MRKLLSWLLSLAIIVSICPVMASATEKISLSASKDGENITVTYGVEKYDSVGSMESIITFPKEVVELVSVTGNKFSPLDFESPDISNANKNGLVKLGYSSETLDTVTVSGTIATLKFKIIAGATPGDYAFTLTKVSMLSGDLLTDYAAADASLLPITAAFSIPKAPITSVTASVDSPVKGQPLDTTVDIGGATGYTAAVEWYEGTTATGSPVTGKAKPSQFYFAKITLKANPGETFADTLATDSVIGDYSVTRNSETELYLTKVYETASATVTKVQIGGTAPTLNVPEATDFGVPGTVTATNTYSVTVFMDGSPVVNPSGVVWSISDLKGVTVDPDTGDLTISSDCPGGQINLAATYGDKSDTAKPTVFRATPAVKWLKIVDKNTGGAPQTTIIRPVGDDPADMVDVVYEAKVYDQFSQPTTITKVDWKLDPIPEHMGTLETVGGPYRLTLHVHHDTEAIPFDLTATLNANPTIKDTATIKVEEKTPETLTVTQADTTYGTPLAAPVFTAPEGTIKTTIHYSTPTSSAYSSSTKPTDAGEYVVNVVCETDTHIYTGHANFKIEPKSISNMLQPITGTYEYTGAPKQPEAVVKDG